MAFRKMLRIVTVVLGVVAAAELGIAAYFYRRTMIRGNAKTDRTIKMAGTDWNQHMPFIQARKEAMLSEKHSDEWLMSADGLRLHATWFPQGECKKIVICFHGYTSRGLNDFGALAKFYYEQDFNVIMIDARNHGESEGGYTGFGVLDRQDALKWIEFAVERFGKDVNIFLHGDIDDFVPVWMTEKNYEACNSEKRIIAY